MEIKKEFFGKISDTEEIYRFLLKNGNGMEVEIINYGAIVTSIRVPGLDGRQEDVVLGFESLEEYAGDHPYFGAMAGRVCNRIGGARFRIDGKLYKLTANEGRNQLHGGKTGFDRKVWKATGHEEPERVVLELERISPHGEEGYPGNLKVRVQYALPSNNELEIRCRAETDHPTHVNLTNHSYFNLNGCKGDILGNELMIRSGSVTELNNESIPTGRIVPVEGTPYDFRIPKPIGRDIHLVEPGYDINYVLDREPKKPKQAALLKDPASGRTLEVLTTLPGLQLYTSNHIDRIRGKAGQVYRKYWAVCLETQYYPDSCNQSSFPSTLIKPGLPYEETTIYRFGV